MHLACHRPTPHCPSFVYSVVYMCQCRLVDIYFIPWVVIQHYFVQMVPALATGSFAVGSSVPLASSHVSLGSPVLPSGAPGSLPASGVCLSSFCPKWSRDRSHAQRFGHSGLASTQLTSSPHLCDSCFRNEIYHESLANRVVEIKWM